MIENLKDIRLIAFDADDTLWDCQSHFDEVEKEYSRILSPWGNDKEISSALFEVETGNMPLLGYGCKAFTISLVENAVKMSKGEISSQDILRITQLGKSLLELSGAPLSEVEATLRTIRQMDAYTMIVFTKGELLDQQNKMKRSGLAKFCENVVIVSDKTREEYERLCRQYDVSIHQFMMVGNSFKSDIEPVLQLGGYAAHIPFHTMWKHEMTQEYDHKHLLRLTHFGQLADVLGNNQLRY